MTGLLRSAVAIVIILACASGAFGQRNSSAGQPQSRNSSANQSQSSRGLSTGVSPEVQQGLTALDALTVPVSAADAERQKQEQLARSRALQQSLQSDTDKLLQLVTELKQYLNNNPGTLSVDMIKKAQEAEKLTHRIKQNMKGQ